MASDMSITKKQLNRYSRQIVLPAFGIKGQERLLASSVLIVGVGGLGCSASQFLVSAGVGKITLIDHDLINESNLQRQVLFNERDCGKRKAIIAQERLRSLNSDVEIHAISERFSTANAEELVQQHDIILDCSDNFGTRYLINDASVLNKKPFISASILRFEGQVGLYNKNEAFGNFTASYRELFPTPPSASDAPNCMEAGVFGATAGVCGSLQASLALQFLNGKDKEKPTLVLINIKNLALQKLSMPDFTDNKIERKRVSHLQTQRYYDLLNGDCQMEDTLEEKEINISVEELQIKLEQKHSFTLIDVREPFEKEIADIGGDLFPVRDIESRVHDIPREGEVILYCRSGQRSLDAVKLLRDRHGFTNLFNLSGGILAWSDKIDSDVKKY